MRRARAWLMAVAAIIVAIIVVVVAALHVRDRGDRHAQAATASGSGAHVDVSQVAATAKTHWLAAKGRDTRIAGIVVGEDGAPVAGAIVRLSSRLTEAGVVAPASTSTDPAGHFDLGVQPLLEYVVSAEAPHTTAAVEQVDLRDADAGADQMKLVLHACDGSIHGTIYDATEGPIRGATVTRLIDKAMTLVAVEADNTGSYELCIPVGGAEVLVSADGYAPRTEEISVYGRTRRDFRLAPGAAVIGRVIRADDKSAVAGALVELRTGERHTNDATLTATSDADGRFHFDAVAPGRHLVSAEADRLAMRVPVAMIAEVGAHGEEVVCALEAAPTVSGHVVEMGTKKPAIGVSVYLSGGDGMTPGGYHSHTVISQVDGSFEVERVTPGEYSLSAGLDTENSVARKLSVEGADIKDLVVEVDTGAASVAGRVVAGGKPVDGADVTVGDETAVTDADGRFLVAPLTAGTFDVDAVSTRVGAFARTQKVTVAAGEHKTGVEISLDLSASISGSVVAQNDAPIAGAYLSFSLMHGHDFGAATTADDGTFTVRALSGGGDYVYEVRQAEDSLVYPPLAGKRNPAIAVADGKTHVTGVRIKVRVEKLAIRGRVVNAKGQGVADVVVSAEAPREDADMRLSATTDETGAFAITDLLAGAYTLRARAPRGGARVDGVAAGKTGVILKLLDFGRITGTWKGFAKPPNIDAIRTDDENNFYGATVSGNSFELHDLPAGRYEVIAHLEREHAAQTVEVGAGETKTVTLSTGDVGTIAGTVVDGKTKAPVAGLQCAAGSMGQDFDVDRPDGLGGPTTDARGAFRIDRVPAGAVIVRCVGDKIAAWDRTTVSAGTTAQVHLTAKPASDDDDRDGRAGMTLENQLDEVLVETVVPGGAAARAGILVGDALKRVNGEHIVRDMADPAIRLIEHGPAESKLVLERADKELEITLKLAP